MTLPNPASNDYERILDAWATTQHPMVRRFYATIPLAHLVAMSVSLLLTGGILGLALGLWLRGC